MDPDVTKKAVDYGGFFIAAIGILANALVVAAVLGDKRMRNTSMYLLLVNLVSAEHPLL